MIEKQFITVPTVLTRGLSEEDKAKVEEHYKASASTLRRIRKHLERDLERLFSESENLDEAIPMFKNAAERKTVRRIMKLLPETLEK